MKKVDESYRYTIMKQNEKGSTEVLEEFGDLEAAKNALELIRDRGYYIPPGALDNERVKFNRSEAISLTLSKIGSKTTETVDHPGVHFYLGTMVKDTAIAKSFLEKFILQTEALQPRLQQKIDEINKWKEMQRGMLVGENTLLCTVDESGKIFHVVADGNIKLAEEIDGFLSGVHHYSPERALELAPIIKQGLRGEGAKGLEVKPINMGDFQLIMKGRTESVYQMNKKSLENYQGIKEIACTNGADKEPIGLAEAVSNLDQQKSKTAELK